MNDITITFLVLAAVVVVFIWDRIPVAIVAIGAAITLWATDILTLGQAFAGFGDPTILFIASLFVVAEALDASGVTAWAGQQLLAKAGDSRTRVLVLMLLLVALLTALITVNASVAALVPVVVVMAIRLRWQPSQLMMPLAFGAHAGSLLALTGTPVNVIISDAAVEAGVGPIGFVEFAYVGIPLVLGTIVIIVFFGEWLLPKRDAATISRDFSDHANTLTAQYGVKYASGTLLTRTAGVAEVVIPPRSGLIGREGLSGNDHRERRSGHAGHTTQGRRPVRRASAGGRRLIAPAGHVGGARQAFDGPRCARGQPSGTLPPAGGAVRSRRRTVGRGPPRDDRSPHHGSGPRSRSPRFSPPSRSSCWACSRWSRPFAASPGTRSSSSAA